MFTDNEPLDNIKRAGALCHAHIATKDGRCFPTAKDELLTGFFTQLREIGYDGRVSIEGGSDNFEEDAKAALKVLKQYT